jgi:hypothetical protein
LRLPFFPSRAGVRMSGNWQAGDLALCVKGGWKNADGPNAGLPDDPPRKGEILAVAAVQLFGDDVFLRFGPPRFCLEDCWHALKFRKIHPLTEEEHRQALTDLDVPVPEVVS